MIRPIGKRCLHLVGNEKLSPEVQPGLPDIQHCCWEDVSIPSAQSRRELVHRDVSSFPCTVTTGPGSHCDCPRADEQQPVPRSTVQEQLKRLQKAADSR